MVNAETITRLLGGARRTGNNWLCRCPAHDDRHASLSVKDAAQGRVLVHCLGGCTNGQVIKALKNLSLWSNRSFDTKTQHGWHYAFPIPKAAGRPPLGGATNHWVYRDSHGQPLFVIALYKRPASPPPSRASSGRWRLAVGPLRQDEAPREPLA